MTEETIHPVDLHVGNRLRLARISAKMSQGALGAAGGISFQQVQKYEKGLNRLSASMLWEFSKALELPLSWFFDGLPEAPAEETAIDRGLRLFADSQDGRSLIAAGYGLAGPVLRAHVHLMAMHTGAVIAAGISALEEAA